MSSILGTPKESVNITTPTPSETKDNPDKNINKKKVPSHLEWTDQIESLLSGWADTAAVYKWLHDRAHRKYKRKNKFLSIPTMILSLITGSLGIGLTGYVPPNYMSVGQGALGGMGIFIGILQGLQTQFGWAQRSEKHAASSLGWGKLHRNIQIELAVEKEFRKDCDSFVKVCRMEYDRLTEQSPAIPSDILEIFKKTFKNKPQTDNKKDDEELILPDVCDTIKHTKVYRSAFVNPDSLVRNIYDFDKGNLTNEENDKTETEEVVKNALAERIKELDERMSGINQFKLAAIGNRFAPIHNAITNHLGEIPDTTHNKPIKNAFVNNTYHPSINKQPYSDRKNTVVYNEFQGIPKLVQDNHSDRRPSLLNEIKQRHTVYGMPPTYERPKPIDLGIERPNVKKLINKFSVNNDNNKLEIVVDNPLKEDGTMNENKSSTIQELKDIIQELKVEIDDNIPNFIEQVTPKQSPEIIFKPSNVEIPKLDLTQISQEEKDSN